MKSYQKQANDFLKKVKATVKIEKSENQAAPLWSKPGEKHGLMYNITIERAGRSYSFNFWNSINDREQAKNAEKLIKGETVTINQTFGKPFEIKKGFGRFEGRGDYPNNLNKYGNDLISQYKAGEFEPSNYDVLATMTKYDPGTFADFCAEFGYNEDSKKAEKTFLSVIDEYKNIKRLFGDVMEELAEIA